MHSGDGERVRREPEGTVLYRAVQAGWGAFVCSVEARERSVPRFCLREVEAFLRCGVLAHGFARVFCDGCGHDDVVAFSCKGRGFCPSCGAARMVDTAAWLCDAVIPEVPVRQWVLSLPYRVRTLCAYDADACALVRGVLVRAVSGFYERTAKRSGVPRPRAGAVSFVQRFDSGLRLNVHFHVLWLDGVYGWEPGRRQPVFQAQREVNDGDVQQLVRRIRDRVLRALRKAGKWVDPDAAAEVGDGAGDELLPGLAAAAVEGRAAFGARAGQRDGRVGREGRWEPLVKGPLCVEVDGFSLHAGAWVSARDREKLEKLCRYAARPAVAESRLVGAVAPPAVQVPTGPDGCGSAPGSLVSLDALPLVWLPGSNGQSVISCLVSRAHESNDENHASDGERRRAGCCRCIGRGDLVAVLVDGTIGQ